MQELQETWVQSLGLEDPLEKELATLPVFLLAKSQGQRSLVGCSSWSHKSWTQLSMHTQQKKAYNIEHDKN